MFYHSECPDPDDVNLATKIPNGPYYATETFTYDCPGDLVSSSNTPNMCTATVFGDAGMWSLSNAAGNLPKCGKPIFYVYLDLYFILLTFENVVSCMMKHPGAHRVSITFYH